MFSASSLRFSSVFVLLAALAAIAIFASSASAGSASDQIRVTSPRSGATLSNTAVIRTKVSKRIAARTERVELWVGSARTATDSSAPYSFRINTREIADGNYRFRVKAVLRPSKKGSASRALTLSQLIKVIVANRKKKPAPAPVKPAAPAVPPTSPIVEEIKNGGNWNVIFADEFDGTQLNRTKWNDQRDDWLKGGVAYNNLEDDYYLPANTTVSGGNLVQTIRKQAYAGMNYTTGSVNTNKRFSFTYGYVEARMRVPACSGCWPAFWMLPAQTGWPPELDIFEFFNSENDRRPYFSSHWKAPNVDQEYTSAIAANGDYTNAWHTYGMLWTPESVQIFVDGVAGPKFTGKAVPHENMYLIIQQALGKGYNTPDGVSLLTDYVRVYQQPAAS